MCYGWREAEKPLILVRATKTRKHIPYLMAEQVTIRCDGNCFRTQIGGLPVSLIRESVAMRGGDIGSIPVRAINAGYGSP